MTWSEQFLYRKRQGILRREALVPASGVTVDIYRADDPYGFSRTVVADRDGWVEVRLPDGEYIAAVNGERHEFQIRGNGER